MVNRRKIIKMAGAGAIGVSTLPGQATADDFCEEADTTFEVSKGDAPPVCEGETAYLGATIENTGESGEEIVRLQISDGDGNEWFVDGKKVCLSCGESRTVVLYWDTQSGDAGYYGAKMVTNDHEGGDLLWVKSDAECDDDDDDGPIK